MVKEKKKKNNYRIIIISFLLALPFWWGINILHETLEELFYLKAVTSLEMQTASIVFTHDPIRDSKVAEFGTTARSALSVFVPFKGKNQVLYEKSPDLKVPIASITKLMTADIVLKNYNLQDTIKVSQEAIDQEEDFGKLQAGKEFTVRYLLYPLLMESSNDAAFALADDYSGMWESKFLSLMNSEAVALGMEDTVFYSVSGLDPKKGEDQNQINISTSWDIFSLTESLLKRDLVWEILSSEEFSEYGPVLENTNKLLGIVPGLVGGKTGYTTKAKECIVLVTKAPKNKGYIVSIILGSDDRFGEMKNLVNWLKVGYNW
ncbi:MAG: serine hydrolase [Candidatus Paceibacterota bacterium]|jgi:D-alanyl-D-alanine carboxypeptidase